MKNPFSRKKSLENIREDIIKDVENLSFEKQLTLLSNATREVIEKHRDLNYTKYLLDQVIDYLLRRYSPEEAILHLGFIAENIVNRNPVLKGKIEQLESPKRENGVV